MGIELSAWKVTVRAGYRLHLGFYRYLDEGVYYGSIGIALDEPHLELRLTSSNNGLELRTPTEESKEAILRVAKYLGLTSGIVELDGYLRHHSGLGSMTRIYLSTAVAASMLFNKTDLDFESMLLNLGRCRYGCVGYYTFIFGGLAVDSGVTDLNGRRIPKPIALLKVPRNWYVVVAVPEGRGLNENEEKLYMENPTAVEYQKDLYRALVELLTGVKLERIDMFTHAIETIQGVAGKYFSKAQGGFFSSPYGDLISKIMFESGLRGIGQSSWGPTIFGFTDDYVVAEQAKRNILSNLNRIGSHCDVWISRISDLGYTIYSTIKVPRS